MLTEMRVQGYRSLRDVTLPMGRLNVITGPNGSGKSNLYRAMYLIHAAATGSLARTLADEGGMPSVLWAGARRKGPIRLHLGATLESGMDYAMACGLPEANDLPSAFALDPLIKEETVTFRQARSKVALLDRGKSGATLRDAQGERVSFPLTLTRSASVLTQLSEPHRFPQLMALRQEFGNWRFYHGFRTDAHSPLRQPQIGVFTPVLSHDGLDLAAALQTIIEIGDADGLWRAVRQGLDGAILEVSVAQSRFGVALRMPDLPRPLEALEFSDGTLRYLCLLAALLSPRPPSLLALNEPETSLHPDLLPSLARQIVAASERSQVWVTTHSRTLAEEIARLSGVRAVELRKVAGETIVASG